MSKLENNRKHKRCTECGVIKPVDCFAVVRGRYRYSKCKPCKAGLKREWAQANAARVAEYSRKYYAVKPEKKIAQCARYYARHKSKHNAASAIYVKTHTQNVRLYQRAYQAARRANQRMASPPWRRQDLIRHIYALATTMTLADGIARHVDHIVPLAGRSVCGLHVWNNLRVVSARENRSKFNHHTS